MRDTIVENSLSSISGAARLTGSGMHYRPIITLGQGGMANVLLSVGRGPSGFNKLVVLKTMKMELVADEELRQMFLAEARLSARLNHANVVHVHEVIDTALPCIVMEYLEGQPLSLVFHDARERFPLPMKLMVVAEALAGLHYSHELKDFDGTPLNIVHRDVSPQNIFVTYDGVVKLLDFGIAKATNTPSQTRTGIVKGKLAYMPCEQLLGKEIDRRADVYSVGCILWHAATGKKLWADTPEADIMRALLDGRIPKPSEVRPVDPALEAMIMKALSPNPDDRYATALEIRRALEQFIAKTSPGITMREVGELVSELFAEQQAARARQIQQLLKGPQSEVPPPIDESSAVVTESRTDERGIDRSGRIPRLMKLNLGLALVAVLCIVGAIGYTVWRSPRRQALSPAASSQTPQLIQVRLSARPASARFTLDGADINGNPAVVSVPPDGRDHLVRASLNGYEAYQEFVRFDRNVSLEFTLVAQAQTSPAPAESAEPAHKAESRVATGKRSAATPANRAPNSAAVKTKDCDPPYTFENGIKTYKVGCLASE